MLRRLIALTIPVAFVTGPGVVCRCAQANPAAITSRQCPCHCGGHAGCGKCPDKQPAPSRPCPGGCITHSHWALLEASERGTDRELAAEETSDIRPLDLLPRAPVAEREWMLSDAVGPPSRGHPPECSPRAPPAGLV